MPASVSDFASPVTGSRITRPSAPPTTRPWNADNILKSSRWVDCAETRLYWQETCHRPAPRLPTGMRISAASIRNNPETLETKSKKNRNIYEKMSTFLKTHLYLQRIVDLYIQFAVHAKLEKRRHGGTARPYGRPFPTGNSVVVTFEDDLAPEAGDPLPRESDCPGAVDLYCCKNPKGFRTVPRRYQSRHSDCLTSGRAPSRIRWPAAHGRDGPHIGLPADPPPPGWVTANMSRMEKMSAALVDAAGMALLAKPRIRHLDAQWEERHAIRCP